MEIRRFNRDRLAQSFRTVQWPMRGRVTDIVGTIVEAILPNSKIGTLVEVEVIGQKSVLCEVVGFRDDRVLLLPFSTLDGVAPGCLVGRQKVFNEISVGSALLGRVVDPFMNFLSDTGATSSLTDHVPIERSPPNPMERSRISRPLSLGIRAIDGLLTFGDGQRLGIMAGSGVGKSVLLGMIARETDADVNVIALIGERGREVREFIERDLGPEGLARSVLVVVTSDQSPLMKIRGAKVATAIAEYFSGLGKHVLLMMDSLTRVAMAQREVGLAIGEPPTAKGYTPSVFSLLPRLLERTGPQKENRGPISGLYTVLVDGDDFNDPIADATRSILDGHINLTRTLAAKNHYPAIDILTSISRAMNDIVTPEHLQAASRMRDLLGTYQENFDLVQIGAYQKGTNPKLDEALALMPAIDRFLKQASSDVAPIADTVSKMAQLVQKPQQQQQLRFAS